MRTIKILTLALVSPSIIAFTPKIIDKPIHWNNERTQLTRQYRKLHYGIETPDITIKPKMIVIHATKTKNWQQAYDTFNRVRIGSRHYLSKYGALNVSAPYLVARDGTIYKLMPDNYMGRHVIGLNHIAIGIENAGMKSGPYKLTPKQIASNVYLIRMLKKKYPSIDYLIGHYEYKRFIKTPLWNEKIKGYLTEKHDPGQWFMHSVRQRVTNLNLKSHYVK